MSHLRSWASCRLAARSRSPLRCHGLTHAADMRANRRIRWSRRADWGYTGLFDPLKYIGVSLKSA
jgi:hypothetical protein